MPHIDTKSVANKTRHAIGISECWNKNSTDCGPFVMDCREQKCKSVCFLLRCYYLPHSADANQSDDTITISTCNDTKKTWQTKRSICNQQETNSSLVEDSSPALQRWFKEPVESQPWNAVEAFVGPFDAKGKHVLRRETNSNRAEAGSEERSSCQ